MGSWLRRRTAKKVLVHTTDDRTLEGVLETVGRDGLVLVTATFHGDAPVELAGRTWVPRGQVSFVQVL